MIMFDPGMRYDYPCEDSGLATLMTLLLDSSLLFFTLSGGHDISRSSVHVRSGILQGKIWKEILFGLFGSWSVCIMT